MLTKTRLGLAALAIGGALGAQQAGVFGLLKTAASIGLQPNGAYLLPTSQLLKPWGEMAPIIGRPVDMAFDSQRRVLAVLNMRGVALLDGSTGAQMAEIKSKSTSYAGVAYRPGDRELWASETTRNGPDSILVAELNDIGLPVKESRIALQN